VVSAKKRGDMTETIDTNESKKRIRLLCTGKKETLRTFQGQVYIGKSMGRQQNTNVSKLEDPYRQCNVVRLRRKRSKYNEMESELTSLPLSLALMPNLVQSVRLC
jgi:hypothetical protein